MHACKIHQVQLGLQELGCLAVCRCGRLAPLLQCQCEDGMGSTRGIIQVVGSNSPVSIPCLQQLSNVCLCLDLHFPTASKQPLPANSAVVVLFLVLCCVAEGLLVLGFRGFRS